VLADAAAIICVGHDEYVQTQKAFPNKKVVYFPNGVNPDEFLSGNGDRIRQAYKLEDKKILLCVGRLDPQKNQLTLIKALSHIKKFCPDAYLVLVGAVTVQSYWEMLKAEIKTRNLESFVNIVAGLPPSSLDLKDWYEACNVFVLPSIHEPFGIVVLEAWACSKPVVVSKAGNLPELVKNGVNGVHLRSDSPEEMALTLGKLLLDEGDAAKLGAAGRQTLAEQYTWDHIIQKLVGLYGEVLRPGVK
ncbi:MAG: glycosyltransferase family 4 protein, partial [Nitrospirota bacterium]|nr:glycosyltransferase family 4 protein [Nitrospirota bacterium]